MSLDNCISRIIKKFGLNQDDAIGIMDDLLHEQTKLERKYTGTDLDRMLERSAIRLGEAQLHAAQVKKKAIIRDIVLSPKYDAQIEHFESQGLKTKEAIVASLVGTHKGVRGARISVDISAASLEQQWVGEIVSRIEAEQPTILKLLQKDPQFRRDVVKEMFVIEDTNTPTTGNKDAFSLAKILSDVNRRSWDRVRRAGADVGELKNWLPQSHDSAKLIKVDATVWTKEIIPLLDIKKSFGDVDLNTIQTEILPGIHHKIISDIKAPASKVTAIEKQHRELFFKDADSLISYSGKYGNPDFIRSILTHLRENARLVAVMETLGSNPKKFINKWLTTKQQKIWDNPELSNDEKKALTDKLKRIDLDRPNDTVAIAFQVATGRSDKPHNITFAKIASFVRGIVCLSKLGRAALSSISDVPISAGRLRVQGVNLMDGYTGMLGGLFEGKTLTEKKEIAYSLGVAFDGLMGDVYARYTPEDEFNGRMTKALNNFFKISGLTFMTERQRQTFALMSSAHMAQRTKLDWNNLGTRYRHNLEIHGIDSKLWTAIQSLEKRAADGRDYIIPQAARMLNIVDLDKYLALEIEGLNKHFEGKGNQTDYQKSLGELRETARIEIEDKLARYFIDETDYAVLRPDGRTRMWQTSGLQPGTVLGEAMRFMWQFKSFSLAFSQRVLGARLHGGPNQSADYGGLAETIASSMVFGALALTVKDISSGREPRDFSKSNTWIAAFLQGGGAGIYGDFLFSTQSRYGHGVVDTVLGPTIGPTFDLFDMGIEATHGDFPSAARLLSIAKNNTPYMNLWYTRAALDYLILYRLQEWASPGSLKRLQRRLKKEYGQEMIVPPTTYIKRGGF